MYVRVHAPDPVVWKDPGGFSRSLGFSLAKPLVSHESHQYSSSASFRYWTFSAGAAAQAACLACRKESTQPSLRWPRHPGLWYPVQMC